ncbi:BTAD domain-containing putative transcriptional regulator [Micromonospora sp. WMMD882]|uniref:BTAD domain-containing putative transcriptional regulator n=1 Tax=Micromonospora sp. WMMD882 TaxID=3015151 RepID=UPI00248D0D75|nr:BTAD domain-containing putative transcriptional regulator [Micromonospora sp. WMMD882]WBB78582.1 BTAD domain-containing putative transcriptional regulator [Micromonospora sp. WMMD882]
MPRSPFVLAQATAVAALVTVAPVVLVLVGDATLPRPSVGLLREWIHQPLTPAFLTVLGLAAAWLVWALLAVAVAARVYTATRRLARWLPPVHLPRPLQGLTAAILGASAITTSGVAAHAAPAPTPATATFQGPAAETTNILVDASTGVRPVVDDRPTHTVRRGESLSSIAKHRLGDRDRWDDIYALNLGTRFPTGGALTDPDVIHPGWVLDLPATANVPPNGQDIPPPPPEPPADAQPELEAPSSAPTSASPSTGSAGGAPPPASDASPAPPNTAGPPGAACDTDAAENRGESARGVTLPSGSWLGPGLAGAIAAAVALVWAHRRRRHVPGTPSAALRSDDPDLTPMPRVVDQIRRGLRRAAPPDPTEHDPGDGDIGDQHHADAGAVENAGGSRSGAATSGQLAPDLTVTVPQVQAPAPAHRLAARWPAGGLALTGPGAPAAARGLLTAALASGHGEHPDARARVVMSSATATALLGDAVALPETPRLTVTGSLDAALRLLEAQIMRRSRLVEEHEVDTVAALRRTGDCGEPLPPILLIADAAAGREPSRIAVILAQGHRLDIRAVLLAAGPEEDSVVVDTDGTTTSTAGDRPGISPADVGRLAVLTPAETIDLITMLAEAHTGARQTPAAAESTSTGRTREPKPAPTDIPPTDAGDPERVGQPERDDQAPADADTTPDPVADAPPHTASTPNTDRRDPAEDPADGDDADTGTQPGGPVAVRVLGDARIVDMDTTVPLRAKSLELLVYLVVHEGDATQDAILDDLLPDAPRSKAPHRLHTYVSALRKTLSRTGGAGAYLTHPPRRYALNRQMLDVDLWRMRDALRDAERATDPTDRLTALRAAVHAYGGGLAEGFDYEWIEAHREGIRRQAVDAHLALATATTDPAEALTVLEAAIRHDPYAEPLYQQAMRVRAALGHLDEIRALRRTLARRLGEIDVEPSEDTTALADQLITDLRQRHPSGQPGSCGGRP